MAPVPVPRSGPPDDPGDPLAELELIYHNLRRAMIAYFGGHRVSYPEELADEVFLRLIKKVRGGLRIKRSLAQYCWRVARFVAKEQLRRGRFEDIPDNAPAPQRSLLGLQELEIGVLLQECMNALSDRDIEFVRRYLHEDREALAKELNTTRGALAIRFYKLKRRLEEFVRRRDS